MIYSEVSDSEISEINKILQILSETNPLLNIKSHIKFNHKKAILLIKKNISNYNPIVSMCYEQKHDEIDKNCLLNPNSDFLTCENDEKYKNKLNNLADNIFLSKTTQKNLNGLVRSFSFDFKPNMQIESYFDQQKVDNLNETNLNTINYSFKIYKDDTK